MLLEIIAAVADDRRESGMKHDFSSNSLSDGWSELKKKPKESNSETEIDQDCVYLHVSCRMFDFSEETHKDNRVLYEGLCS